MSDFYFRLPVECDLHIEHRSSGLCVQISDPKLAVDPIVNGLIDEIGVNLILDAIATDVEVLNDAYDYIKKLIEENKTWEDAIMET